MIILNQIALRLTSMGMTVIIGGRGYNKLSNDIEQHDPDIVMVCSISEAEKPLEFTDKPNKYGTVPFFIFTTAYKSVYEEMLHKESPAFFVIYEPYDMNVVRDIIERYLKDNR
ncbi:MAG: hypothetical protein K2K57_09180 [Oscillospiraceae bacterium]|nr:hypothetical protein [Oscillospiraceae bacterium]